MLGSRFHVPRSGAASGEAPRGDEHPHVEASASPHAHLGATEPRRLAVVLERQRRAHVDARAFVRSGAVAEPAPPAAASPALSPALSRMVAKVWRRVTA